MAKIQYIEDKDGVIIYPVTHEKAIKDSNGVNIQTKIGNLDDLTTSAKSSLVSAINEAATTGTITVDTELSESSVNPVQNKVITTAINEKQDELVSGTNIKTVNNESLLGSGNITIQSGSDPDAVKYIEQSLTSAQKAQARKNIGSCSADLLSPVDSANIGSNVQYVSQSLTSSQKEQARLNIGAGTSSFSGSYNDLTNKPTIPLLSNDLSADKTSTTKAASAKDTYDAAHPAIVTSIPVGGMRPNVYYKLGTLTGNVTFNLAEPTDPTIVNHYFFSFYAGDPAPTVTWPSSIVGWASGIQPTITSLVYYEISILDGYAAFLDV